MLKRLDTDKAYRLLDDGGKIKLFRGKLVVEERIPESSYNYYYKAVGYITDLQFEEIMEAR